MVGIDIDVDFIIDDYDKFWFINVNADGLFYVDKSDCAIHFVCSLPDKAEYRLYNSGIQYEGELFFFPFYSDHILIYNIHNNSFEMITSDFLVKEHSQYSICFIENDTAVAVSTYGQNTLLLVDLKSKTLSSKYISQMRMGTLSRDFVVKNGRLFLTMIDIPVILEINLSTYDVQVYRFDSVNGGFGTITSVKEKFILSAINGIYEWDVRQNKMEKFAEFPVEFGIQDENGKKIILGFDVEYSKYKQPFWRSIPVEDNVYLISASVNMSVIYNLGSHITQKLDLGEVETEKTLADSPLNSRISYLKHIMVFNVDNNIAYSSSKDHAIFVYFTKRKKIIQISNKMNVIERIEMMKMEDVAKEGELVRLNEWLKYIAEN